MEWSREQRGDERKTNLLKGGFNYAKPKIVQDLFPLDLGSTWVVLGMQWLGHWVVWTSTVTSYL